MTTREIHEMAVRRAYEIEAENQLAAERYEAANPGDTFDAMCIRAFAGDTDLAGLYVMNGFGAR